MNPRRPTEPKVRQVGFNIPTSPQPSQPVPPPSTTAPIPILFPAPVPPRSTTAPIPPVPTCSPTASVQVPVPHRAPAAPVPGPVILMPRPRYPRGKLRPGILFRGMTSVEESSSHTNSSVGSEDSGEMSEEFVGWFEQGMSFSDSEMMAEPNVNVNQENRIPRLFAPPRRVRNEIPSSSQQQEAGTENTERRALQETQQAPEGLPQESMSADVSGQVAPGRTANQPLQSVEPVRVESSDCSEQSSEDEAVWFPLSMSFSDNEATIERNVNVNPEREIMDRSQTTNADMRALQEAQHATKAQESMSADVSGQVAPSRTANRPLKRVEPVRVESGEGSEQPSEGEPGLFPRSMSSSDNEATIERNANVNPVVEDVRNTIVPPTEEVRNEILSSLQQLGAQTTNAEVHALQEAQQAAKGDNIAPAEEVRNETSSCSQQLEAHTTNAEIHTLQETQQAAEGDNIAAAEEVRNETLSSSQQLEAHTTNIKIHALQETQSAEDPANCS